MNSAGSEFGNPTLPLFELRFGQPAALRRGGGLERTHPMTQLETQIGLRRQYDLWEGRGGLVTKSRAASTS